MEKICILGAGSFGTSIGALLERKGFNVVLWNRHLDIKECLKDASWIVSAVPAQSFREVLTKASPFIKEGTPVVNLAKGLELETNKRLSEIAEEIIPGIAYVALSGPSHAEEVAKFLPTTVCVSSEDEALALRAQNLFMSDCFRVYTNDDLTGTEYGGALKNIIALGSGILDGMQLGDNTRAALMTRGIAEITRLGVRMGAKPETFMGLTGIGDLIVTCCSMYSRNRRCGILLGQGYTTEEAVKEIGQVVESLSTVKAAYTLAKMNDVEMPITEAIYNMVYNGADAQKTVERLMARSAKPEH